ncbi:dihydroneopterin aldolase [Sandarakinorhabdus sp.]|uniref:dihydroneopterin aldolase n=1 Tax=Sandarakinorhabdus sp. TaxID=1916663 RepID=UPI003F6FB229
MPDVVPPPTFIEPLAHGLVPNQLAIRTRKLFLEGFDLHVDIGFHAFEVGAPQILRVSVEVWVDADHFPRCDTVAKAWDYDFLRQAVLRLVEGRRFNLQETVAHAIYDMVAARSGVVGLKVSTRKPDVYPDCQAVGVELSSF